MGRKGNADKPWRIDSGEDVFLLSMIAILLGAMFAGVDDHVRDLYVAYQMSKFAPPSGDTLIIPQRYIDRFAEDFSTAYTRYEVAYCVTTDNNTFTRVEVANIRAASERDAIFSCPSYFDGFVHLHPNGYWEPSKADLKTLENLIEEENRQLFMCIYYGRGLGCWTLDEEGKVKSINVEVK